MRNLGRALILILLIVVVSGGVYYVMEDRNDGALEKAGEEVDKAMDDLSDEVQPN